VVFSSSFLTRRSLTRSRAGLSLVETVISLFLLTCGFTIFIMLFDTSLRFSANIETRAKLVLAAQRTVDEIRAYASVPANFATGLSPYQSLTRTDPDLADMSIATSVVNLTVGDNLLRSPSNAFEASFSAPPDQRRALAATSVYKVKITTSQGGYRFSLLSLICEPNRGWSPTLPLAVTGTPSGVLAQGASCNLSVVAADAYRQTIPDLFCRWAVVPETSVGTIEPARDGRTAVFTHKIIRGNGTQTYGPPGICRVQVTAQYFGVVNSTTSSNIELGP